MAEQLAQFWDGIGIETLRERGTKKWAWRHASDGRTLDGAWVAEMDLPLAAPIRAAIDRALDNNWTGYLPPTVMPELTAATADFVADRYAWPVTPADVYPVPDVLSVLELMITELTAPGERIIVPTPAYMPFLTIPSFLDRRHIEVPSKRVGNRWELDLDGIEAAFQAGGRILILCNPWNPTGRAFTRAELLAVAEVVSRYPGAYVFADEIHAPLTLPGHIHIPYASISETAASHSLTATAASKGWNIPGLHCAQVIAQGGQVLAQLKPALRHLGQRTVVLGAVAAAAAYREGRDWLDAARVYLGENMEWTATTLRAAGYEVAQAEATYLCWWDAKRPDAADIIAEKGRVGVQNGRELGRDYPDFIRLNTATPRPVLKDLVERTIASL